MPEIHILLIGDIERTEFRESASCLQRSGVVEFAADVETAEDALIEGRISPDAIVVAQSFPGQFSHRGIDRLRRAAPLARILGLMGSWCEGEMRSGRPWPATARLYWHQWPARCRRQFLRLANGERCSFALPATATEEERLLADIAFPLPKGEGTCGLAVVRCRSFETWDWLRAACRQRGLSAVWQRDSVVARVEGATAAVFDCTELNDENFDELRSLAAALSPAPVIALLPFPRIEDYHRAISAGAGAAVSKPLLLDDLFAEIVAAAEGRLNT